MAAEQDRRNTTSAFVNGAAVLGLAAVISKLLGTLQKIPMQNIGGDEAFGIYNAVFPFYTLILFLATAGFPITVSKFVSEYIAENDLAGARRVLRVATVILTITGLFFFLLLFLGAGWFAALIDNHQTKLAIQSISFALLFVPVMATLRGYFQGRQNMIPTGISQVVEQMVRVATMVALLLYFTSVHANDSWVAAGATFGSVTGAIAGWMVMLFYWFRDQRAYDMPVSRPKEPLWPLIKRLMLYALPVCLGAIVLPILSIVDTFSLPRLLKQNGFSESEAMIQFGIYARGLPLVQLVAMLFSSMSVALVPAIAEAKQRGDAQAVMIRTELSVRFTWLVGWAASVGLAVAVVPINIMLYTNDMGSLSMSILAFTALFSSLNIITASILQGLGAVLVPAFSLLFAAAVKVALNVVWVPAWGIEGAALATVLTFMIASAINLIAIQRNTAFQLSVRHYFIRPFFALFIMGIVVYGWVKCGDLLGYTLFADLPARLSSTVIALTAVGLGTVIYVFALFWVGAIRTQDLNQVPSIGNRLVPLLEKLRMIKER